MCLLLELWVAFLLFWNGCAISVNVSRAVVWCVTKPRGAVSSNSKRGNITLLMWASLALLHMSRTVKALSFMDLRYMGYMTAPYARSEASMKTCTLQTRSLCFCALIHRGTCMSDKRCNWDVYDNHLTTMTEVVTRPTRVPVSTYHGKWAFPRVTLANTVRVGRKILTWLVVLGALLPGDPAMPV